MKILVVYGSNSGNTKAVISFIKAWFKNLKINCIVYNAKDVNFNIDFNSFNLVILSSPTWGGFNPGLQDDFAYFWQGVSPHNIQGNNFAVIGLGDLYYPSFCKAVDFISDDIVKYKGNLLVNSLAIPDDWVKNRSTIEGWLKNILNQLLKASDS